MICSWCWFSHPATAISTNRNGSRTLGIVSSVSRDLRTAVTLFLADPVFGPYDVTAFDEIYDIFNHRLLSFLTRMAKNRSVAEDLLEETWLRLVSGGEDLHADTRLGPWLFTVARNLFLSHCRSRAREQAYTRDLISLWHGEPSRSPYDSTFLNEFQDRLEAAM